MPSGAQPTTARESCDLLVVGSGAGAREGGRSVCAAPFDARELGPRLAELRPPLDLIAPWGMGIATGAAGWAPVSHVRRRDGSVGNFPHLIERAKPGLIAVTRAGRRFANEADSYYDFMTRLFAAIPRGEPVEAWLLCDHRFIRRYGLGHAKPAPMRLAPSLRSGYLRRGDSIGELARACGIDAQALQTTVDAWNRDARDGRDPAFGRGGTPYNRVQGDPSQRPNPCVAPIEAPPYYAVRVVPGSLGAFARLRCDAQARVLDREGRPVAGLYACGNDMASVMGGHYPSGGITLGPAMTFGYIAAHHAAGGALEPTRA